MKTKNRLACVAMLSAGLFGLSQQAMAQVSDTLFVYGGSRGNVLIDTQEGTYVPGGPAGQTLTVEAAIFGPLTPFGTCAVLDNCTLAGLLSNANWRVAALMENPAYGSPDPTEVAIVTQYGIVSDLVLAYFDGRSQPTIALLSDGNPIFSDPGLADTLNTLDASHFYLETPGFVDVSSGLQNGLNAPGTVMAYSDVPVPGAVWLFGSALGLFGLRRKLS